MKIYIENLRPNKITLLNGVQSDKIIMHSLDKQGYFKVKINESKPLLHSLDKLINNILDDDNDYFYQLNYDLCEILETTDCEYFVKSLIGDSKYVISTRKMIEALEFLKQNHFNIYYLAKEMYIEKSESNGK